MITNNELQNDVDHYYPIDRFNLSFIFTLQYRKSTLKCSYTNFDW